MKEEGNKRYKDTPRDEESKKKLINRCNRISGQMNGVAAMIEEDRYCEDILIQLSAISNCIKSLATEILEEHMNTCMVENIRAGKRDVVESVTQLIKRYRF